MIDTLFKTNLMLWLALSVSVAVGTDTFTSAVFSYLFGKEQIVSFVINITCGSLSITRLIFRGKYINKYDIAISIPAIVTCMN